MGTSANPVSDDDDGCVCPICRGPFRDARVPPCGHALCLACLRGMIAANRRRRTGKAPECPTCKVSVHESQYVRCYALDKAVDKLHPRTAEEKKAHEEETKAATEQAPADEWTVSNLRQWQAAERERLIRVAISIIIESIKDCEASSDALLLSESNPPAMSNTICPPFGVAPGPRKGPPYCNKDGGRRPDGTGDMMGQMIGELGGSWLMGAPPPQAAPAAETSVNDIPKAWSTFWKNQREVATRLKAKGLQTRLFRHQDERYARR